MTDEVRPAMPSYNKWVSTLESDECNCEACYIYKVIDDRYLISIVFGPDHKYDAYSKKARDRWMSSCPRLKHIKKVHHKGNGKPKGLWAGTLTMAPTDPYNEDDMVQAVRKLFKQETCPVEKYAWYLEYTVNELPHIHFIYKTPDGGRIHAKVFKRVWKLWDEGVKLGAGHKGGYHRLVADEEGYLKYIEKDHGRHDSNWTIT